MSGFDLSMEMHKEKPGPCYAPVYAAALYPELAALFREHGYALAVHGSLRRDFDLVAIPWGEEISNPLVILREITSEWAITLAGELTEKPHGRLCQTIAIGGFCSVDLSFIRPVRSAQ